MPKSMPESLIKPVEYNTQDIIDGLSEVYTDISGSPEWIWGTEEADNERLDKIEKALSHLRYLQIK